MRSSRLRRTSRRALAVCSSGMLIAAVLSVGAEAVPSSFVEMDGNVVKDGTGTYDWSNGGTRTATTTTDGIQYNRPTAGGVFDGGTFVSSTHVPIAPTRTAAAAADTSIAVATFKPDPLSVDANGCGTGDPTSYTGAGSEVNGGLISSDTFGTSSVPNKDDLSNVYALAHVATGANEVFFGGERVINNGDSHIDYEFLQSTVSIPAACSGSFSGHRTQGDFLASVDFTSGGSFGGQHIYKWVCGTVTPNPTTHVCDPNGKKTGPHYSEVTDNATLSALKVNVNGGGDIDCGGWACRSADGTSSPTILQNGLMEGAIDLQQLGFNGCISTFLPHTRSSQSFTAVLKDFEIIPFNTCAHPTVSTTLMAGATGTTAAAVTGTPPAVHLNIGDTLHDTANLASSSGTPTGTYAYSLFSGLPASGTASPCTATSTAEGSGTFSGTAIPASSAVTFTQAGTYAFQVAITFTDSRNLGTPKSGCLEELVIVAPNSPAPHSTPKVQIKDHFSVTGFSSDATGSVVVGLYTNSACTTRAQVDGVDVADVTKTVAEATAGADTTFVAAGVGDYYYKISYAGDSNNQSFSDCTEHIGITTITSLS